jgi:hypothetical protein
MRMERQPPPAPSGLWSVRAGLIATLSFFFAYPIAQAQTPEYRKPGDARELKKAKKAILLASELDPNAFNSVQDELDYAYAVKSDKEKKRAARAKTKGIKALNMFIAQALLREND